MVLWIPAGRAGGEPVTGAVRTRNWPAGPGGSKAVRCIGGKRADPERRQAAVERLGQLRASGELTAAHVRLAASGLGVRERTVWRWLRLPAGQPTAGAGRVLYQLSEADREAYTRYRGNVAAVHRARQAVLASPDAPVVLAAGVPVPASLRDGWRGARPVTERTLQRAFRRELTAAQAAAWAEGEQGQRAAGVYLTRPAGHRNQTWEMDHKQLPILVMPPRGAACCPWLTSVIDDATRVLAGWAIALTPHTGTVLTAVRMALVHDPDRGPFGAVPDRVRIDRGLEFAAEAVRDAFAALSIEPRRLPAFQPHRKGKIERVHRTIDQTLLCGLPGFTGGPRDAAGRLYGPLDDRFAARMRAAGDPVTPLPIEAFAGLFGQWADWYNNERPHDGLDGRTPLQAWQDDPGPLHRISAGKLRHLLLASGERIIGKDGSGSAAWPTSPRSWRAGAGSGCRSGICRTMTAASRSTSARSTCVPPARRPGCPRSRPRRSWRTPPANASGCPPSGARHPRGPGPSWPRCPATRPAPRSPGCCRRPSAASSPPAAATCCCAARPAATCSG
jgi:putative transposase